MLAPSAARRARHRLHLSVIASDLHVQAKQLIRVRNEEPDDIPLRLELRAAAELLDTIARSIETLVGEERLET